MKGRIKVALLIDKSGSYDRGLIRGILDYSKLSANWDFLIDVPDFTGTKKDSKLLDKLQLWDPDFIVMNDNYLTPGFHELDIPILVTPSKKIIKNVINIIADDSTIGKMAAQYFINKGFSNFAFYGSDEIFWSKIRKYAFKETIKSKNLNFYEFEAQLGNAWVNNPKKLSNWMKDIPKPIAVFGCCDEFAIHAIKASRLAGYKIPDEVAVMGVDNDEFICELYDPPMSSIDQNPESVGFKVAQYIYMFMKKERRFDKIIGSEFSVVSRRSTDIFAVKDEEISKALQFIKENASTRNVNVEEVVSATLLSRRLLEIRFRKILNRSILDEIKRIRMDAICKNLIQSDIPINDIAFKLGFTSITTFNNFFKREKKISPSEFRKQFYRK